MNTLLKPRPADIERAVRIITAAETDCKCVFSPGQRRDLLCDNTVWPRDYIAEVVKLVAPVTPQPPLQVLNKARKRLLLQANGMIVVETSGDGFINTTGAKDVRYRLEYKAINRENPSRPWVAIHGEFTDETEARKALRMSNRNIHWRLVAFNAAGWVALPRRWEGFRA